MPNDYFQYAGLEQVNNPPVIRPEGGAEALMRWRRDRPRRAREAIMQYWVQDGGPASPVGLPIDPNFPVLITIGDELQSEFRGGRLTFKNHDGSVTQSDLHQVVVTFEGFGLEIRQESGDEIYGSIHVEIGTTGFDNEFVVPEVVLGPEGHNRIGQLGIVLYEGPPVNLNILLSLTEHDSGDRAAVREEVRAKVKEIFKAAKDAAAGGMAGPAAQRAAQSLNSESIASSSLQDWMLTGVADLINEILGMGDDAYNPVGFTITAAQMQNIPPMLQYRCSSDPRVINFSQGLSRMATCRDDGGDVGQITALFSIRPT
jgi:hypothetical protein